MPPEGHTVIYDAQTNREFDLGVGAQTASFSPDSTKAVWSRGAPGKPMGISLIDLATGDIRDLGAGAHAGFTDDSHVGIERATEQCQLLNLTSAARANGGPVRWEL